MEGGGGDGEEMFDSVGFRFEPTEIELIVYHLKRKIAGFATPYCFIMDWDIYRCEPWFLPRNYFKYWKEETEMYFFTPRHPSSGCARRASRTAGRGYWDGYGRDKLIMNGSELVGNETSLVFKLRNGKEKIKTDWIMHEYRMHYSSKDKFDDLELCKIYNKKKNYREELDGVAEEEEEEEERLSKRSRIEEPSRVLFDQVRVDEVHSDLTLIPTSSTSEQEQGIYTTEQEGTVALWHPNMDCHGSLSSLSPMPPLVTWEGGFAAFTSDVECNASSLPSPPVPRLASDRGFTPMTPGPPAPNSSVLDYSGSLPLPDYFGLEDLGFLMPPEDKQMIFLSDFFSAMEAPISPIPGSAS